MAFLCESVQPTGARASHSSSMTRCSTWLKYLYLASTFLGRLEGVEGKPQRKKKCEKQTLMEKPGILRAQVWCLKEEEKKKILFCHGLWGPGRSFIGLWRIDTVCVSEAKGDWFSIGTLLEGRLEFFIMEVWMSLSSFWGVVKSVC